MPPAPSHRPPHALRAGLEALRDRYETAEALALDPLAAVLAYPEPEDRELAAWVAAHLAYGRVAPMLKAIARAMAPLGPRPARWLREAGAGAQETLGRALGDWKWRFHTREDLVAWLGAWRSLDAEGGVEGHFVPRPGESPDAALSRTVQRLRRELPASPGTRFTLPDPMEGAACKRWRMFLRWMVRPAWPDLGQWTRLRPAGLVIPLDTHVARVSRYIGLSHRATPGGEMAAEVTAALAELDPEDPLRYDFALSHLGILGDCPGLRRLPGCAPCPLVAVCRAGRPA